MLQICFDATHRDTVFTMSIRNNLNSCDFYIRDPWSWKSWEMKRKTDIRTLQSHSNLINTHLIQSVLWCGCDDGDDDENGDRMRDFSDNHNGWKHQHKQTQPCLKQITCFEMCCPLTRLSLLTCLYMCPLCAGCDSAFRLYIQYYTDWEGHLTLLLHWKVGDISCHSIGNESHSARSISVAQCRVTDRPRWARPCLHTYTNCRRSLQTNCTKQWGFQPISKTHQRRTHFFSRGMRHFESDLMTLNHFASQQVLGKCERVWKCFTPGKIISRGHPSTATGLEGCDWNKDIFLLLSSFLFIVSRVER